MNIPPWRERLFLEIECLRQFLLFGRRHRRYLTIALGVFLFSLFSSWRLGRVQRWGFCALQWVDDLLDGDRASTEDPVTAVNRLMSAMRSGDFDDQDRLHRLMRGYLAVLDWASPDGEGKTATFAVIEAMLFDRKRVIEQIQMSDQELKQQHLRTFEPSVNLLLLGSGATTRVKDCPEIVDIFGWCSTVRDLEEDLAKGLLNLPREFLPVPLPDRWSGLASDPTVTLWLDREAQRAERNIRSALEKINRMKDARGRSVLRLYVRSMSRYLPKKTAPH